MGEIVKEIVQMNKRVSGFLLISGLVLFSLISSVACVQATELKVVTTFSILEDFVRQIGGDRVEVSSLIPSGADPHSWEPTPREARLVAKADLLVANGGGFDQWLVKLQKSAARPGVPVVYASDGLVAMAHGHATDHDHDHDSEQHTGDPHFWLSVPNAISYVERITEALVASAPDDSPYFLARSQAYCEELAQLDQKIMARLQQIPEENRVIVTYHNAFSYLAERYGFAVVEFLVDNPEAEPSPRDLGRLVQLLKQQPNPVIFAEPQLNISNRYVQTLATEIGGKVYVLYSDSLSSTITTYVELMDHNAKTLVEALQ